jgi:transcriptional regulator with XRE-family HTH domain
VQPDLSPAAGETIGERLKRLRLDRGFSQRELASPGVSYAYISRIEAGTRTPSVKALRRLAAKLGVSADYLETGSDLDAAAARELRLMDLELAVRLGDGDPVEPALEDALAEASAAGDHEATLRARVALAQLALERGEYERAVALLEGAIENEAFSPVNRFDIYANLGRAYASAGNPDQAARLYERCIAGVEEAGGDPALEARYATLLSYALTDMGEIARAEEVVRRALDRVSDTGDPYMRVRLYWSIARRAHTEGRESVALDNVRKAIALLKATDDTFHLARAHILAAGISLGRDDAEESERHLQQAEQLLGAGRTSQDTLDITQHRARIAVLRGDALHGAELAREALELSAGVESEEGIAASTLADALAASGEIDQANEWYGRAVKLLEESGRWRIASTSCRAWGRMLRENGRETQALDVLDKAAELGMRAAPEAAHLKS